MRLDLKTHIRKLNQSEFLAALIVLWPFTFGALIDLIGLPNMVKYVIDVAWITLLILMVANFLNRRIAVTKTVLIIFAYPIIFFLFTLITYVFNYQDVFYYLWGVRNNFRFYVAFAAFVLFVNKKYIGSWLKLFDKLFWMNAVICLFQFFVLDKKWDHLGGFFGVEKGCNGYLNIFMVIIIVKTAIYYLNQKESLLSFLLKSAMALVLAGLAELKFFFIEYVVIVVLAFLMTKFTLRKLGFVCVGLVSVIAGYNVLILVFPNFINFFTIESMLKSATLTGYAYDGSLNRLTAIPMISENFLTTGIERAIGFGLGNCDTAAYDFLNTPFYQEYYYLRYNWFSTAFTYLETGFIGLTLYFGFFVMIFGFIMKKLKKQTSLSEEERAIYQISAITAIMCCLFVIYNSTMRTEAGYIAYFVIAFPFIGDSILLNSKH